MADIDTSDPQPPAAAVSKDVSSRTASPSNKRRRSDASDSSSKRPRLDSELPVREASPPRESSPAKQSVPQQSVPSRRKDFRDEDRKRGQRLFGGLLGALGGGAAQKRRRNVANTAHPERPKVEVNEKSEETRKREREELLAKRQKQQEHYQREKLHLRHKNMRAMARHLKTKAKPEIYYLPYKLSVLDEETIEKQLAEVEAQIAKELAELPQGDTSLDSRDTNEQPHRGVAPTADSESIPTENYASGENGIDETTTAEQDRRNADAPSANVSGDASSSNLQQDEMHVEENDSDKDEAEGAGDGEDTLVY